MVLGEGAVSRSVAEALYDTSRIALKPSARPLRGDESTPLRLKEGPTVAELNGRPCPIDGDEERRGPSDGVARLLGGCASSFFAEPKIWLSGIRELGLDVMPPSEFFPFTLPANVFMNFHSPSNLTSSNPSIAS